MPVLFLDVSLHGYYLSIVWSLYIKSIHNDSNLFIQFENNDFGFSRSFHCRITSVHNYNSFKDYLGNDTLEKCLPGIDTI